MTPIPKAPCTDMVTTWALKGLLYHDFGQYVPLPLFLYLKLPFTSQELVERPRAALAVKPGEARLNGTWNQLAVSRNWGPFTGVWGSFLG